MARLELKDPKYFLRLTNQHYIDAKFKGNIARFVYHSCDPNSVGVIVTAGNLYHFAYFAHRRIEIGGEITIFYASDG